MARGDRQAAGRVKDKAEELRVDRRPPGAEPVKSRPRTLRVRVGSYRVVYQVDDDQLHVLVVDIGHRSNVYDDKS